MQIGFALTRTQQAASMLRRLAQLLPRVKSPLQPKESLPRPHRRCASLRWPVCGPQNSLSTHESNSVPFCQLGPDRIQTQAHHQSFITPLERAWTMVPLASSARLPRRSSLAILSLSFGVPSSIDELKGLFWYLVSSYVYLFIINFEQSPILLGSERDFCGQQLKLKSYSVRILFLMC